MCAEREKRMFAEQTELSEAVSTSSLLQQLKRDAKRLQIDNETMYIVEGDLLWDEDQLGIYALQREAQDRARNLGLAINALGIATCGIAALTEQPQGSALVGITRGGKIVRWKEGLVFDYCVLRGTFSSQRDYELVRDNMKQATEAWQKTCGIAFEHKVNLDANAGTQNPGVLFTVRGLNAGGQFIAAAFFPDDPVSRRRVLIDPSYFDQRLTFNKVGVLRHELGHVLGFRHEHIRSGAPPDCPDEPLGRTIDLTQYDPQSVMHYFCGGMGNPQLAISELDRVGSQKVYGPPFGAFHFVE